MFFNRLKSWIRKIAPPTLGAFAGFVPIIASYFYSKLSGYQIPFIDIKPIEISVYLVLALCSLAISRNLFDNVQSASVYIAIFALINRLSILLQSPLSQQSGKDWAPVVAMVIIGLVGFKTTLDNLNKYYKRFILDAISPAKDILTRYNVMNNHWDERIPFIGSPNIWGTVPEKISNIKEYLISYGCCIHDEDDKNDYIEIIEDANLLMPGEKRCKYSFILSIITAFILLCSGLVIK